jgi:hypothetical protein
MGGRMIPLAEISPTEELFTHLDDEDGVQRSYAVTRLRAHLAAHPEVGRREPIVVDEAHTTFCITHRGIETYRLLRLRAEDMAQPMLFVGSPDAGKVLLLDGTHRYVRAYLIGIKVLPAIFIPAELANEFLVVDVPPMDADDLMKTPSGL